MAYQSKHTGTNIDNNIDQVPDLQTQINDLNSLINSLNNSISIVNTNIINLQSKDTDLQTSINTINSDIDAINKAVVPITQGGTGATTLNNALINLGGAYSTAKWEISGNTTGTISTTLNITTHGRPVFVGINYTMQGIGGSGYWGTASIFRDTTHLHSGTIVSDTSSHNRSGTLLYLDTVPAGTYTYKFQYGVGLGTIQLNETNTPSGGNSELPIVFAFEI